MGPILSLNGPSDQPGTIHLENAPIVLLPDANRTPLAIAAKGSSLILVKDEGAWLQVQFQDPRFGLRNGYIQKQFVTVQRPAERPLDLSVPAAQPAISRPPSVTPPPPPAQAPSAATVPARPSEQRPVGTPAQTITFRKVDYSVTVATRATFVTFAQCPPWPDGPFK